MSALNQNLMFNTGSGKMYPWALPSGSTPVHVARAVLGGLTKRLQERLLEMGMPADRVPEEARGDY